MKGRTGLRVKGSLGRRLAAMTVLALLPMSLLGVVLTRDLAREVDSNRQLAASGAILRAAAPEIAMISAGRAMARTIAAAVPPLLGDEAACDRAMDAWLASEPAASLVAYIPLDGRMTCASGGARHDFIDDPLFARLTATALPGMVANPRGPVSSGSVLGIGHPVFGPNGAQTGIVSVSLPHRAIELDTLLALRGRDGRPGVMITFDAEGNVLTSSSGLETAQDFLPPGLPLATLAQTAPTTVVARSGLDERRLVSVLPLAEGLFLLGSWPEREGEARLSPLVATYLVPMLTWIAGLAVALFAAETLVTNHIRKLGRSMVAFSRGERTAPMPDLRAPPVEIAALDEAYRAMIVTIQHDEAELENLLHQKAVLLREVHHRTGNSLQLIASVMAMHLREDPGEETQLVLTALQERVSSLSTVHMGLYRIAGADIIAMDDLLGDVISKIVAARKRSGHTVAIARDLAPVELSAEQAVPLALLLAEVLAAFPSDALPKDGPSLCVALAALDSGEAQLRVTGPAVAPALVPGAAKTVPDLIAGRLVRAFVTQLGGRMDLSEDAGILRFTAEFLPRQAR